MKNPSSTAANPVGLLDWLKHSAPAFSLALGASCGCDIARLGRDICDHLNAGDFPAGGRCRAFDPDEIRMLAGDPFWRHAIFAAADRKGIALDSGCDYQCMIRAIAALGGAVLSSRWALEATENSPNVFKVELSQCDRCCPAASLHLDPDAYSEDGLAKVIARRFVHWIGEQGKGKRARSPLPSALPVLI